MSCWQCIDVDRRLDDASDHILSFLDARDATVTGTTTTYKNIRDTFDAIVDCGYFSRSLSHDSDTDAATTNGHDLHGMWLTGYHSGARLVEYEGTHCRRSEVEGQDQDQAVVGLEIPSRV